MPHVGSGLGASSLGKLSDLTLSSGPSGDDDLFEERNILGFEKPSFLERVGDTLGGLGMASANTVLAAQEGEPDRLLSAGKNIINSLIQLGTVGFGPSILDDEDRATYEDVLAEAGWGSGWDRWMTGLALDIVADPINLVSLGAGSGAKLAGKSAAKIGSRKAAKRVLRSAGMRVDELDDEQIDFMQEVLNRPTLKAAQEDIAKRAETLFDDTYSRLIDRRVRSGFKSFQRAKTLGADTEEALSRALKPEGTTSVKVKEGTPFEQLPFDVPEHLEGKTLQRDIKVPIRGEKFSAEEGIASIGGIPLEPTKRSGSALKTIKDAAEESSELAEMANRLSVREARRQVFQEIAETGATSFDDLPDHLTRLFDRMGVKLRVPFTEGTTLALRDQTGWDLFGKATLPGALGKAFAKVKPEAAKTVRRKASEMWRPIGERLVPQSVLDGAEKEFLNLRRRKYRRAAQKGAHAVEEILTDPETNRLIPEEDRKIITRVLDEGVEQYLQTEEGVENAAKVEELRPQIRKLRQLFGEIPLMERELAERVKSLGIPGDMLHTKSMEYYVPHIYTEESLQKYLKAKGQTISELFSEGGGPVDATRFRQNRIFPLLRDAEGGFEVTTKGGKTITAALEPKLDVYELAQARVSAHTKAMEWVATKSHFAHEFGELDPVHLRAIDKMWRSAKEDAIEKAAAAKSKLLSKVREEEREQFRKSLNILIAKKRSLKASQFKAMVSKAGEDPEEVASAVQEVSVLEDQVQAIEESLTEMDDALFDLDDLGIFPPQFKKAAEQAVEALGGAGDTQLKHNPHLLDLINRRAEKLGLPEISGHMEITPRMLEDYVGGAEGFKRFQQLGRIIDESKKAVKRVDELRRNPELKGELKPEMLEVTDEEIKRLSSFAERLVDHGADLRRKGAITDEEYAKLLKRRLELEGAKDVHAKLNSIGEADWDLEWRAWDSEKITNILEHEFRAQEKFSNLAARSWEEFTRWEKVWLTTLFPAFHARNLMSGIVQGALDDNVGVDALSFLRPGGLTDRVMYGLPSASIKTADGRVLRGDEILEMAERMGVMRRDQISQEVVEEGLGTMFKGAEEGEVPSLLTRASQAKDEVLKRASKGEAFENLDKSSKYWGYFKTPAALGELVGTSLENRMRLNGFISNLKSGMAPQEAADRVGRFFVDYTNLSKTERVFRTILPFYKFDREMIPAMIAEIAKRPIKGTPIKVSSILAHKAQQDGVIMPPFLEESLAVPIGEDAQGNPMFVNPLKWTPFDALAKIGTGEGPGMGRAFEKNVLGSLNPAIKFFAERQLNKNFFFGGPKRFYDRAPRKMKSLPEPLRDVLGVRELPSGDVVMDPHVQTFLRDAPFTGRATSDLMKMLDERKPLGKRALDFLGGVNVYSADQNREAVRKIRDLIQKKARLGEAGELPVFFVPDRMKGTPKGKKLQRLIDEMNKARKHDKETREGLAGLFANERRRAVGTENRTPEDEVSTGLELFKSKIKERE